MKKPLLDTDLIARYLLDERDNKSKEMIDKIIHDDENSRREFDEYVNVWEQSARVGDFDKVDPEKDWLKVRSRMHLRGNRKRIPIHSYLIRIAAILILALGLAYLFVELMRTTSNASTNYFEIAALDETREVNLPDGSTIYLNKHSKIIRNSNFGVDNRDIILEGEAFFEVSKNKDLPFKVHSLNSTVEVVGTSFNIHTDSMQVVVSVIRGRVVFYASENTSNRIELEKDNAGIFEIDKERITPRGSIDYNQLAWHTGVFKFNKEPLYQICSTLASYYDLEFVPGSEVQFIDSITVDFNTKKLTLEEFAHRLCSSLDEKDIVIIPTKTELIVTKK